MAKKKRKSRLTIAWMETAGSRFAEGFLGRVAGDGFLFSDWQVSEEADDHTEGAEWLKLVKSCRFKHRPASRQHLPINPVVQ